RPSPMMTVIDLLRGRHVDAPRAWIAMSVSFLLGPLNLSAALPAWLQCHGSSFCSAPPFAPTVVRVLPPTLCRLTASPGFVGHGDLGGGTLGAVENRASHRDLTGGDPTLPGREHPGGPPAG